MSRYRQQRRGFVEGRDKTGRKVKVCHDLSYFMVISRKHPFSDDRGSWNEALLGLRKMKIYQYLPENKGESSTGQN
jgi:hypothetical protein